MGSFKIRISMIVLAASIVLLSNTATSHHSFSATFTTDEITVTGVVTEFRFRNPHAMIYFDVTDESGEVTSWRSEGGAANLQRNRGWASDEIKPGELSRFGDYYAYYEGDTLVIENINLLSNLSSPNGNRLSDQATTVETYQRADDPELGPALTLTTIITDPAYLSARWTLEWMKWYTEGL